MEEGHTMKRKGKTTEGRTDLQIKHYKENQRSRTRTQLKQETNTGVAEG